MTTNSPRVGIMSSGDMGSGFGKVLHANGLEVYLEGPQPHDVAEAALFFSGTGHYDIMQLRRQLPADTQLALQALRAQVYTPMGARK